MIEDHPKAHWSPERASPRVARSRRRRSSNDGTRAVRGEPACRTGRRAPRPCRRPGGTRDPGIRGSRHTNASSSQMRRTLRRASDPAERLCASNWYRATTAAEGSSRALLAKTARVDLERRAGLDERETAARQLRGGGEVGCGDVGMEVALDEVEVAEVSKSSARIARSTSSKYGATISASERPATH